MADYETLELTVPSLPPGVLIHDPKNLEYIFKHESIFSKGSFVKDRAWDLFGHGIINADGDMWRSQRKAGAAFLSTANLRVLTDVALPKFLGESIEFLEERSDGKQVVDLQDVFHEITTQLMGKMAYNMEMHTNDTFSTAFDYASGGTAERFQNPLWFITELFTGSRLRKSVAIVKNYGREIVSQAIKERHHTPSVSVSKANGTPDLDQISGTLINSLLDAIPDTPTVADAALNYLSAGRDTTAQSLTWTFHLLLQTPHALSQIRSEVQSLFPSTPTSDIDLSLLTPQSLPYTLATFYESLRLFPPIPMEIKQLVSDQPNVLPDGTVLPPNSVLVWCLWAMGRSKRTWGEDAEEFRPERWLEEKDGRRVLQQRSAAEFPVFNGGPRSCLGKKMAEGIAVMVLGAMAVGFEFVGVDDARREKRSKTSLTLPMEGGLPVFVRRRRVIGVGADE
jgi:cytochrome P450